MLAAHLSNKFRWGYYAVVFTRCMFIYKAGVREHGSEPIGRGRGKAGQVGGWCGGWWEHFTTLRMISTPTSALAFPIGLMVCKVSGSIPAFSEWTTLGYNLSCKYSEIIHGPIDPLPVRHWRSAFNSICSKGLIYSTRFHL
jgi:hypothetical protein